MRAELRPTADDLGDILIDARWIAAKCN